MKTLDYVRLIFLKDMRALRWPLLILAALTVADAFLTLDPAAIGLLIPGTVQAALFLALGIFAIIIPLFHSDPAGREFRFLLTRPVPGAAVGLAKALFLTLFLILPYCVAVEFSVISSRVAFTPLDHLLLLIETIACLGAALAALGLCCVFLRNRTYAVLTIVLTPLAAEFLGILWTQRSYATGVLPFQQSVENLQLFQFRDFLAEALFLAVSVSAIALRYRTRGFKAPLAITACGIALGLFAFWCPYNFARPLEGQTSTRDLLTPAQVGRIHMTLISQRTTGQPSYDLNAGESNGIQNVILNQPVHLDGIDPPYFFQTAGYHAILTLRSGKRIVADYEGLHRYGDIGGSDPSLLEAVAGLHPSGPVTLMKMEEHMGLEFLTYIPKDLGNEDLTGAAVRGVITLNIRRMYVAGSIPLRSNASFDLPRRRYEITHVEFTPDEVRVNLIQVRMPLILRGDLVNRDFGDEYKCLVVNRRFAEALQQTGISSNTVEPIFATHAVLEDYTFTPHYAPGNPNWRLLPPDWASGAELMFFGSEPCGQVTLPYQLNNVTLTR